MLNLKGGEETHRQKEGQSRSRQASRLVSRFASGQTAWVAFSEQERSTNGVRGRARWQARLGKKEFSHRRLGPN